jgi:AcrR family transcriptional regulator
VAPNNRDRLVEATVEALGTKGFASTSARTIAALADVNPGLIFYYFGTLDELLVTALRESSEARLARHRPSAEQVGSPQELVALLRRIYREDLESGYIRVVCEMVSGSVARPALGERVTSLMQAWIDLAEEAIERALGDSPVKALVSPRDLAFAGVTFYLGANLVVHLGTEPPAVDGLLAAVEQAAGWFGSPEPQAPATSP